MGVEGGEGAKGRSEAKRQASDRGTLAQRSERRRERHTHTEAMSDTLAVRGAMRDTLAQRQLREAHTHTQSAMRGTHTLARRAGQQQRAGRTTS